MQHYASWLDAESYAYRTEFFEITVIKQAFNFWIDQNVLPADSRLKISMTKPTDTDTYCYRREEVEAMVELCRAGRSLSWLGDVLVGLACTGLRISELANMRWSNIDLVVGMISLVDDSRSKRAKNPTARTTKSRRGRSFPIHNDPRVVLERLQQESSQGRVFRAAKGGSLRPDNVRHILINRVINPLTKQFPSAEDEVGFKAGRLHSLRHYFCSICANGGVPEQVVMRWLGHRSSDMVKRYYHLHDEEAQRQMARIDFGQFGTS